MHKISNQDLGEEFWNQRWKNEETGWDTGHASPALVNYLETLSDKSLRVLIPGCGNAYEAEEMIKLGFTNITLIDISEEACERLKLKFINHKEVKIFCEDFFAHSG